MKENVIKNKSFAFAVRVVGVTHEGSNQNLIILTCWGVNMAEWHKLTPGVNTIIMGGSV